MKLSEKVGEPWVSFYNKKEIQTLLEENGFSLEEDKTLEDLNKAYFTAVGRKVPEDQLFNLEHFAVARRKA